MGGGGCHRCLGSEGASGEMSLGDARTGQNLSADDPLLWTWRTAWGESTTFWSVLEAERGGRGCPWGGRATDGSGETEAFGMGCRWAGTRWEERLGQSHTGAPPAELLWVGGSSPQPCLPKETPFLPALAALGAQLGDGPSLGLTFLFRQMGKQHLPVQDSEAGVRPGCGRADGRQQWWFLLFPPLPVPLCCLPLLRPPCLDVPQDLPPPGPGSPGALDG